MKKTYMGVPREDIPWYPRIDKDLCTLCGACKEFCPNDVFEAGAECMLVKNPMNCVVGCDKCMTECPVAAISFPDKAQLLKWIEEAREKKKQPAPEKK
jgi:NAD-dependent dihydropyrimidine dehydrogenase PreA subunit